MYEALRTGYPRSSETTSAKDRSRSFVGRSLLDKPTTSALVLRTPRLTPVRVIVPESATGSHTPYHPRPTEQHMCLDAELHKRWWGTGRNECRRSNWAGGLRDERYGKARQYDSEFTCYQISTVERSTSKPMCDTMRIPKCLSFFSACVPLWCLLC